MLKIIYLKRFFKSHICINNIVKQMSNRSRTQKLDSWRRLFAQSYSEIFPNNENTFLTSSLMQSNKSALVCHIDGVINDIACKIASDNIEYLDFSHPLARDAFWRSTAFIISGIIEDCFQAQSFCSDINDSGFYCDAYIDNRNLSPADFPLIEAKYNEIVNSKAQFERLDVDLDTAKEFYRDNAFKLAYISSIGPQNGKLSIYKCGDIIDVCSSPLVRHSGQLKVLRLITNGSVRNPLKGNENSIQRIYGISFPNKDLLKEWSIRQEEAKKRDHRRIGQEQKLFFFHNCSVGSPFMLPHGHHICMKLIELIREQYGKRGFKEVTTPNIFDCDLLKTSGHWDLYQENLFKIPMENGRIMSLKPMNCPGHCLIYAHEERWHNDLPLKFADFGALHRNEYSGALTGMTRLRKFHQDDAHIFCRPDQIGEEISASLDFLEHIYKILDFKYSLTLSTRPQQCLGQDSSLWDLAEQHLRESLDKFCGAGGVGWTLSPGEGAFYGPKVDIAITDALGREHQCATIQLDFQLPQRFDLKYTIDRATDRYDRPVIIHRAILGSVERLLAILIESNCGRWPFWLSPRQVLVVPVSHQFNNYADTVCRQVRDRNFMGDCDLDGDHSFNKKIRLGQLLQYNCILVVGEKELSTETVTLRTRDGVVRGIFAISDLLDKFDCWQKQRTLSIEDGF